MRKYFLFSALFFSVVLSMNFKNCRSQTTSTPIELVNSISLTNISGRLGHMAYNNKQQVVYLAALSNNTMEIIDLQNKKTIRSIKSLRQPIDVEYIPNVDIVFVACLGDGLCRAFNANNFKEEISLRFDNNVSIVRFSPTFQMLYVGYGDGSNA